MQVVEDAFKPEHVKDVASDIITDIEKARVQNLPNKGHVLRRKYSAKLKAAGAAFILALARELLTTYHERWLACELIRYHPSAFSTIGEKEVEAFGDGINSWGSVDQFARSLAGPAWLNGRIADGLIHKWASSEDRWWRRASLVSTVALNVRTHGGTGDTPRTLEICRLLVNDHDDMVVKAMSWALRELVIHDPGAVSGFINDHEQVLAARVKREVRNKLTTGAKNPKRKLCP